MYRLNVIGCGKVGRVLARLLIDSGLISTLSLVSRSDGSARSARDFIGVGELKDSIAELPPADLWMVTVGDAGIAAAVKELAQCAALRPGSIVFHCSGALGSEVLAPLRGSGACVGSAHPIRSFADPELACRAFPGTSCSLEGDSVALERLRVLFEAIGGQTFELATESKTLCHAGHVIVSNYLVALLDVARRVYESAGVPRDCIDSFMVSLARGTLENVQALGTTAALTGPIVRGEVETVRRQLEGLRAEAPLAEGEAVYALMGLIAAQIAERRGALSADDIKRLRELLQ